MPEISLTWVAGYCRSHRGRDNAPFIRSITHAPDQTYMRLQDLHCLFDLAISRPLWIIAWIETIFMRFRGPNVGPNQLTWMSDLKRPFNLLALCECCVRSVCLVPQITHSLWTKSGRKPVHALRLLRCHSADIRLCPLHIRLASKSLRKISCRRGRNTRVGTCSPPCGQRYSDSRLRGGPDSNRPRRFAKRTGS